MDMAMGLDRTDVKLMPTRVKMKQELNMPIFKITDWSFDYDPQGEGISLRIRMHRKITTEMMTTYFPSLLLTAITFATTFFKPFFFEAALSVNLTTMLVMTTIFISKMESLPHTSDIKMIDIWLVLCQMVPFFNVVLITAMEVNREDGEKESVSYAAASAVLPYIDEEASQEIDCRKSPGFWQSQLKAVGQFLNLFDQLFIYD